MSYLLVVRHARTEWNRVERFRGRAELDLDEVGLRQAQATATSLVRWQIKVLYTSPLTRARRTAGIIGESLRLTPIPLPQLIDIDYGAWQGLTLEEAAHRDGQLYRLWLTAPHLVRFPGGEGAEEARQRVQQAVELILRENPQDTVALVSHKIICKMLILVLLGWETSRLWQVEQDISAINVFEFRSGQARAILLNDTCHLEGL